MPSVTQTNTQAASKLPDVFRAYDIRGCARTQLTPQLYYDVGRAFATRLSLGKTVCVGHDTRKSSDSLVKSLIEGLIQAGMNVIFLGPATTPLVYWAEYHFNCDAALMVTGSHTPPDFNGLKMSLKRRPFYGNDLQELKQDIENQRFCTPQTSGLLQTSTCTKDYVHHLTSLFTWSPHPLKIVWDFGCGAPALLSKRIQETLPFQNHFLHETVLEVPTRSFDPTSPGALEALKTRVLSESADVGIAFDGDGDRLVIMDAKGHVWSGDELLFFFATFQDDLHKVVADIKTSPLLMATLPKTCETVFSCTGHVHIKTRMRTEGALLGGEVSGHFFFKDHYFGFDDGFYAALRLLEILQKRSVDLFQWRTALPKRFTSPEYRIPLSFERHAPLINALKETISPDARVDTQDGLKVCLSDQWWIVRSSQTEAVLVLRWESLTENDYQKNKRLFESLLQNEFSGHFFL